MVYKLYYPCQLVVITKKYLYYNWIHSQRVEDTRFLILNTEKATQCVLQPVQQGSRDVVCMG